MPITPEEQQGTQTTITRMPSQNEPHFVNEQHISLFKESEQVIVPEALNTLDEFLATPMANANAIGSDFNFNLYPTIIEDTSAALRYSSLAGTSIIALSIGAYVAAYRNLRNREQASHFFYFKRLLESKKSDEILKLMGESDFDYEILSAAAHFYSPDISKFVAWKRRFFCYGNKRIALKKLQAYWSAEEKNKEEILDKLFLEIIKKVVIVLNKADTNSDALEFEVKSDYLIGLTERSRKKNFSKLSNPGSKIGVKKNPSFGKALLGALGETTFIYWLAVFVSCLIPFGIVGGVAVAPLVIAGGWLLFKCGVITYQSLKKPKDDNNNIQNREDQEEIIVRNSVELKKREAFISTNAIRSVAFKGSLLHKELQNVLKHRRFNKFHAGLQGFVEGCFFPFFVAWVLTDLTKLLLALAMGAPAMAAIMGPAAPIVIGIAIVTIAIVTLVLGIGYGIYSATKAVSTQETRYEKLLAKIECLEKTNIVIPDLSLQAHDRLLRRYSLEEPLWTRVKKVLNRGWVVIKRLGTGSLVFRLIVWGTITACAVIPAGYIAPIAIPFILIFATVFAVQYYRAYNVNSQLKQAETVIDQLYSTHFAAEKGSTSVLANEAIVQASTQLEDTPVSHLDGKLSPEQQPTEPVEIPTQKASVVAPSVQEEELARPNLKEGDSAIENTVDGAHSQPKNGLYVRSNAGFWPASSCVESQLNGGVEREQPTSSMISRAI